MVWVVAIVAVCMLPAIIWSFKAKPRGSRTYGGTDQQAMTAMIHTAQRLEARMNALEQILDAEIPNWRNRL